MTPLRLGACLSLTGRYARFGTQAARGLQAWRELGGGARLQVEDDGSDPRRLAAALPGLAARCDLLLGPYSTQLTRAAVRAMAALDGLLWNHGGSGDDVESAAPGRLVSVLTPASRYAEPFLRRLAAERPHRPLWVVAGRGSFGRQVAAGAEALARQRGLAVSRAEPGGAPLPAGEQPWDLLCAGQFEEDVETVTRARSLPRPPRTICAVAAGVREFGAVVDRPEGVFGIAQWFPGTGPRADVGPSEVDFVAAYSRLAGRPPDYPAVQAAAAAVLAMHCATVAGSVRPEALWSAAASLDTTTLFGAFRIDVAAGVQVAHQTVLLRWAPDGPRAVPAQPAC